MIIFLLIVIAIPTLLLILNRIKNRRFYELANKIPAAKGNLPLIGIAHKFIGSTGKNAYKVITSLSHQSLENGGIVKFCMGPNVNFVLTNVEDVDFLLKSQLGKTSEYVLLEDFIGKSTLNAPVPIWKRHRKILIPNFTSKMMENYFPIFVAKSKKLVDVLEKHVGGGEFELFPHISAYELAIVCETSYGLTVNCQEDSSYPVLVQVETLMEIASERLFMVWQHPDWIFKLTPHYSKYYNARQVLYEFMLKVINDKRDEMRAKRRENPNKETEISESEIPSFLELVLSLEGNDGYTDMELMQELIALTLAGTDTSAISLSFLFELLSKYPDVQEKLYQEIHDMFGDSDRTVEKEDIPKLQYLDMVFKESLRLYSAASVIGRRVEQEIKLPSGVTLPANCDAFVSIYGVHRDPQVWGPDAEVFDPDRFLPGRYKSLHPCSFLPFSYGQRNCPGFHFGTMTLKIAVIDVLRKFKIVGTPSESRIPKLEAKFDILAKPLHAVRISVERRK
ncbi:unnamed protein product [Diatraea saccharalis]|uniref:Cytochrome P450 n=1 Tax=Diatraea saccharalis TaxID=40085 RepID=A0A9N9QXB0_9NEOP|nr:unnamed protein product [Diatraea saccharalis]